MPQPILGTNLSSAVVPFTDADQFPTHHALYGKGGWRSVNTIADRDAIPVQRLEDGMVVYINELQIAFVYMAGNWQELALGGSTGKQTFTRLYFSRTIAALPPETTNEFQMPFGKTSMILKLTVSRPVRVIVYSTPDYSDTNPYTFLATASHLTDDGSVLMNDGSVLRQRNYSIFANFENPPQERVYAVIENIDDVDGPVTIDVTYIVIETDVGPGSGTEGIDITLNTTPFDTAINTLDFSGPNWSLQNSTNGLPAGTVGVSVSGGTSNYVVPMSFTYSPEPSEILLFHTFVETVTFAEDFAGSAGFVETPPQTTYLINFYKNGNIFGAATVNPSGVIIFSALTATSFAIGDTLKIVAPALNDGFIANLSISLLGTRS
jgi:hypothetical protein